MVNIPFVLLQLQTQNISIVVLYLIVRPISDAVSGISTEMIWMHDKILKT